MQYNINISGFEGRSLTLHSTGIFSRAKLTIDGKPAPVGSKSGTFLLNRNDGSNVTAGIRYTISNLLGDPVPILQIGEQFFIVERPFKWYEWTWASITLLMVFFDGIAGFLIGVIAMQINLYILRWSKNDIARIVASGMISLLAILISTTLL